MHLERGTSLIEILVSLTILSVGALGLIGASASVNRMLARGRWSTVTLAAAERRLELLRAVAGDSAGCASLSSGSAPLPGGLLERWTITPGLVMATAEVEIIRSTFRPDTVAMVLLCR